MFVKVLLLAGILMAGYFNFMPVPADDALASLRVVKAIAQPKLTLSRNPDMGDVQVVELDQKAMRITHHLSLFAGPAHVTETFDWRDVTSVSVNTNPRLLDPGNGGFLAVEFQLKAGSVKRVKEFPFHKYSTSMTSEATLIVDAGKGDKSKVGVRLLKAFRTLARR